MRQQRESMWVFGGALSKPGPEVDAHYLATSPITRGIVTAGHDADGSALVRRDTTPPQGIRDAPAGLEEPFKTRRKVAHLNSPATAAMMTIVHFSRFVKML